MNQLLEQEKTQSSPTPTIAGSILIGAILIAGAVLIKDDNGNDSSSQARETQQNAAARRSVAAVNKSRSLSIRWGDLGQKLVSVGVVDREKFLALYDGVEREIARRLIDEPQEKPIAVTEENAGILLNLLWGVGLGNKSKILEEGQMTDPRFGGAERFASTGGWTISNENHEGQQSAYGAGPMSHYSRHPFAVLTAEQEDLVARVANGIYRPCCDNPTHFPDCNHGMAMLGLLELLAADGATEEKLYEAGLVMNQLWFPSQYEVIDRYVAERNTAVASASAKTLLSAEFASASGFQKIARALETAPDQRGESGGCSV